MGVTWEEEGTEPQRIVIRRLFDEEARRGNLPPRVMIFRREVSGRRKQREVNARGEIVCVVVRGEYNGQRIADLVTAGGQSFPYALPDATRAEIEELEQPREQSP